MTEQTEAYRVGALDAFLDSVAAFSVAADDLEAKWQALTPDQSAAAAENYPFDRDFEELVMMIAEWSTHQHNGVDRLAYRRQNEEFSL